MLGDDDPVLGAELLDLLFEDFVLIGSPEAAGVNGLGRYGTLALVRRVSISNQIFNLLPPLEASDLSLVGHELADPVPGVLAEHLDQLGQLLVLLLRPEDLLHGRLADPLPLALDPLSGLVLFDFGGQSIDHGIFVDE